MKADTTMTIRMPGDLGERLGRLAESTRRSRSLLAAEAVSSYVDRELGIVDGIRRGLADVEAGRVVPHDEAVAQVGRIIASAREG